MSDNNQQLQELIEYNDELENYFRNTIIPQLYIDGELKLRKFTPPAMKQFNLSPNHIGKPINAIRDNLRFPTIEANIEHVISSNEILEKEIQTTDLRWYQMNILPYFKLRENRTDGVIITFVEITRRIKDLKEQEKLISENSLLLDTIAHDLKNPIANLIVAVDLVKTVPPGDEKEFNNLITAIDQSVGQLDKVIGDLAASRKVEDDNKSEEELLNFEHILEDVRLTLRDNVLSENATITKEINTSEMKFSRRKLRSVVYNLINNAIKFKSAERQPEIVVATYEEGAFVVISVKDNGIGIDESQFDEIFTKYGRINNSIEGTGVGLYLVNEIVTNAGGKVLVKSEVGVGSEFQVYLKKA